MNVKVGDRVKLRGREPRGVVDWIGTRYWVRVNWDADKPGPKYVHKFELEIIDESN